jgi:ABC-type transporter Mla subunit MlaD
MTRQAQVGLFTLIGIIGMLVIAYEISNIGARASGYKMAIHFRSAAGLRPAAIVYMAGVSIGVVDRIDLRPDYTTDVVLAVKRKIGIPIGSRFIINIPLTGEPSLQIVPPKPVPGAPPPPTYPRDLAEQMKLEPQGTNPATLTDLLEQGQGEIVRLDSMLAQLERVEPQILTQFQSTLKNANELTVNANASLSRLSSQAGDLTAQLSRSLDLASTNVVDLTSTLNSTAKSGSTKVNSLLASLDATATSLSSAVDSLRALAQNPEIHDNLIATTRSVALTAQTFAELTGDLRRVTGNEQTQEQLRDTVAHIDAAAQKADSLLAQLGGKSHVYGVDTGASPAPGGSPVPGGHAPPGAPAPSGTKGPGSSPPSMAQLPAEFKSQIGSVAHNLAQVQIRLTELSPERPGSAGSGSPLLTADRGPQTDINFIVLPRGKTNAFVGINNIGYQPTTNVAAMIRAGNLYFGGGVLYSTLGVMANLRGGPFGLETRFYDPRHATLDMYGHVLPNPHLDFFVGGRDLLATDRRAVFGLQTKF